MKKKTASLYENLIDLQGNKIVLNKNKNFGEQCPNCRSCLVGRLTIWNKRFVWVVLANGNSYVEGDSSLI